MEAVQNCEKLAYEYGNQQIDQPHLLYSLLTLDDSLIMKLITKMGIQGDMFKNEAKQAIEKLTKVSGGGQLYISNDLNKVLINAEDESKAMGDEYVSVEHIFLSMLKYADRTMKELFRQYGGRLVTTGSDAHKPQNCGQDLLAAQALLRAAGFDCIATFERRQPRLHKI